MPPLIQLATDDDAGKQDDRRGHRDEIYRDQPDK